MTSVPKPASIRGKGRRSKRRKATGAISRPTTKATRQAMSPRCGNEQAADDAADAGDASVEEEQHRGGAADEHAAGERAKGSEVRPVHGQSILAPFRV